MTTFLTLLIAASGIFLAAAEEGRVVVKKKNKRKKIKYFFVRPNLEKLSLFFMLTTLKFLKVASLILFKKNNKVMFGLQKLYFK